MVSPLRAFLRDSRATGIVLVACTVLSLVLSNTRASGYGYTHFWIRPLGDAVPGLLLPHDWLHWINDGLMTLFFFLVGMEIKRELLAGELTGLRKSLLPVLAALGGMLFPALIYFLFNGGSPFHHGWGIPMATDIAFSLGILSLVGDRVPVQLKIFLTALAIIDDLGAVIVIAVFYASGLHAGYLITGLVVMAIPLVLNLARVRRPLFYFIPGVITWYCLLHSGVHPTIAGVLLALCIPLQQIPALEKALSDPVNFLITPLFALANTAIVFPASAGPVLHSPVTWGVVLGLVLGKPLGIFLFSFVSVKIGIAELPSHSSWKGMWGTGMIAGIGFTMSIFIATLAFGSNGAQVIAKIAILAGSVIAGSAGYLYLRYGKYAK
jgi:NhaA family Na+:H+ antiporter